MAWLENALALRQAALGLHDQSQQARLRFYSLMLLVDKSLVGQLRDDSCANLIHRIRLRQASWKPGV